MASSNRAASLVKLHKQLKKLYKPVQPAVDRPLLEQLLLACCLENAPYDKAETAFAAITESYFDLNEVRVSGIAELAETTSGLPAPRAAAANLKQILQSVFEATYSFDLETMKKLNLGVAVKRMQQWKGTTPFVVSYAIQSALGGHSIPLDRGALQVLFVLGVIDQKELKAGSVKGLERAIAKSKGIEFGSLLHQLGAELVGSPFSPAVRNLLLSLAPDCKDRLPKRRTKKTVVTGKTSAGKTTTGKQDRSEKPSSKSAATKKKPASAKTKSTPATKKKSTAGAAKAKPKSAAKKKAASTTKKKTEKSKSTISKKKSATKRLARKKPR
ncbi:MAG: hypothetical protein IID44_12900 [Planctomycetes bacterium]|nr:hypothetical protein [Planctomycetota bacterium]